MAQDTPLSLEPELFSWGFGFGALRWLEIERASLPIVGNSSRRPTAALCSLTGPGPSQMVLIIGVWFGRARRPKRKRSKGSRAGGTTSAARSRALKVCSRLSRSLTLSSKPRRPAHQRRLQEEPPVDSEATGGSAVNLRAFRSSGCSLVTNWLARLKTPGLWYRGRSLEV